MEPTATHQFFRGLKNLPQPPRFAMSEAQRFLLLSILIGVFAGLLIVCFHCAIDFMSWYTLGTPAGSSWVRTLLSPVLGGAASSLLVLFVFRKATGSGVNHTKAAIYIFEGYVPSSTVAGKFAACSVSLGTGTPLGPEDPALQMGAGIASLLGRLFRISRSSMRMIAPVGAAAGIAAAFNTPITAVLFVIEEVVGAWNAGVLGSIILAAVSAVVVSRSFLGDQPLFRVPLFELRDPAELLVYALIGVSGGLLSVLFVRAIEHLKRRAERLPRWTVYVRSAAAGLLVGLVGLFQPEVMGVGYESIDSALHNHFPWDTMLILAAAKICLTAICFSAGTPGGMFAPSLFIGAMAGGGIGALAHQYWPLATSSASSYVLVGMGTFFAGVFRAPMTSIFMVFELSASYMIILPVMTANMMSYLVSRSLQRSPFFDLVARMEGMNLPSSEEMRERPRLRVEQAMDADTPTVLRADTTVKRAIEEMRTHGAEWRLVWSASGIWSLAELGTLEADGDGQRTISEAIPLTPLPRVYPDLALDSALRQFGPYPALPVCSRAHPDQLLGVLTLEGIHRAYGIGQQPGETSAGPPRLTD
ncbi:MAG: chloride channel protein [Bryobacterales bacterium]|nr:chloride channel protein [Bryobacterales bacterium]